MMRVYTGGILRERWDDETRTYTAWDEDGVQTEQRPYTAEENTRADAEAEAEARWQESVRLAEAQNALVVASIALAEAAHPEPGGAWTQPTGAHDAFAKGAIVTHGGKEWVSLIPFNVWEPGVSGWREVVAEGYPAWVQPTGGHDAYPLGARVTHNGQDWESTAAANVWEPGVFGWVTI